MRKTAKLRQKLQISPSHVIRVRKCVRALIKCSYRPALNQ